MKDISQYFPVLAGSPPAFVLAAGLYKSIALTLGITGGIEMLIPIALAGCGMSGMIATEMMTYKVTARAFARQEWGAFIIAALGVALISGFVLFAVYVGADTKSLVTSTITMLVGYVIIGVTTYMDTHKSVKKENAEEVERQTENQIKLLQAQADAAERLAKAEAEKLDKERLLQNSRNRAGVPSNGRPKVSSVSTEQPAEQLDPAKLAHARAFFTVNPRASARAWLKSDGCPVTSPESASKYKKAVQP